MESTSPKNTVSRSSGRVHDGEPSVVTVAVEPSAYVTVSLAS